MPFSCHRATRLRPAAFDSPAGVARAAVNFSARSRAMASTTSPTGRPPMLMMSPSLFLVTPSGWLLRSAMAFGPGSIGATVWSWGGYAPSSQRATSTAWSGLRAAGRSFGRKACSTRAASSARSVGAAGICSSSARR
ncbi:Uncharacterised protein [Mycobacteroides abscessus subsp. abscessus]|nr:Uncharacterised protein [Mycobacteroides abscessus subsp. abscessus]